MTCPTGKHYTVRLGPEYPYLACDCDPAWRADSKQLAAAIEDIIREMGPRDALKVLREWMR